VDSEKTKTDGNQPMPDLAVIVAMEELVEVGNA
jgi:hypothetical protein